MTRLSAYLVPALVWLAACHPMKVQHLAEFSSDRQCLAHAQTASRIGTKLPKKPAKALAKRVYALNVVGKLAQYDNEILEQLRQVSVSETAHARAREEASWAIGSICSEVSWEAGAQDCANVLIETMKAHPGSHTAYAAVEALGRAYLPHGHTFDEAMVATDGLDSLQAASVDAVPDLFFLVQDRISTPETLIASMQGRLDGLDISDPTKTAQGYVSVLTALRWFHGRTQALEAAGDRAFQSTSSLLHTITTATTTNEPSLTKMTVWYLGRSAHRHFFADMIADRLQHLPAHEDRSTRVLGAWTLGRQRRSAAGASAIRSLIIPSEADPEVLSALAHAVEQGSSQDILQTIFGVTVETDP